MVNFGLQERSLKAAPQFAFGNDPTELDGGLAIFCAPTVTPMHQKTSL
jgi:hypothetical protein